MRCRLLCKSSVKSTDWKESRKSCDTEDIEEISLEYSEVFCNRLAYDIAEEEYIIEKKKKIWSH